MKLNPGKMKKILEKSWKGPGILFSYFCMNPVLMGTFSNLQVTRTGIKSKTSSIFSQIRLFALELSVLELRNTSPYGYTLKQEDL